MKPLKLFMNTRPAEQPANTYPFAKNGVQFDLQGTSFNEPGFLKLLSAVTPYTLMGVVETDSKPVLMSTDNTNSAIGFFNPVTKAYEPILDDATWDITPAKLGFNMDYYITGESQRNYKGELIITFTDKKIYPMYLNCDKPNINSLDDLRLYPFYNPPVVDLQESSGGSLESGTYYVSGVYEKNDGTTSPYFEISRGITIAPGVVSTTSDKAILITLTNIDTNYDFVRLSIISKVKGIVTAVELSDSVSLIGGTVQVLFTGDNISDTISVQDIIVPGAVYSRVGTMGQLNDALYVADLEKESDLNDLQPYALKVQVKFQSELIDATSPPKEHITGAKKSFMHQEVYALYIQYKKTRGGYTKSFIIPGTVPIPDDLANSTEAAAGGSVTSVPKYKVEDTIPVFDSVTKTGKPGVWKNETELYPDTVEFDASGIAGPNMRNQPVLHHKMPSLRWCKANFYSSIPEYGKTKLDLLGIKVSGVEVPTKYADVIDGYRILYAKRSSSNSTIYGQCVMLHGAVTGYEESLPTGVANIYTTGGNWGSEVNANNYNENNELRQIRLNTFRFHAFDLLFAKPNISPSFVSAQLKLKRTNLETEGYFEDGTGNTGTNYDMPTVHLVDYTLGLDPTTIPAGNLLRAIDKSFYLEQNFSIFKFNNTRHEGCYAGTLLGSNWPLSYNDASIRLRRNSYTEPSLGSPGYEEAYLVNLLGIKSDLYLNFYSQSLVSAGSAIALNATDTFWGGDTFCCDYTFHTYGRHDGLDTNGEGIKGKKIIRRIVCESSANIHLRYEIPGNEYSKWYPRTSITSNNPDQCYITRFDRSKDPNQFGYTKDLNALNDFVSSTIYNPFIEEILNFPYRIHRHGKLGRQNKFRNWRTALPLDYYEMQKNMGKIVNVEGMNDRLLIHCENALFRTQDKARLEGGQLSVTLGTGDIFQFEPQEANSSKLGYAGTQHDLACVRTPFGYIFPDAKSGEIFLYDGDKLSNIGIEINVFLREYFKGFTDKNPYTGNGITIGWDPDYKRILFTVKNKKVPTAVVKVFQDTDTFYDDLVTGDLVDMGGRVVEYKGLNNSAESGFSCPADPPDPDEFEWRADDFFCESDDPVNPIVLVSEFDNQVSPAAMLYKQSSSEMYVADYDGTTSIVYKINLTTGIKSYMGATTIPMYAILKDEVNGRFYFAGESGGGMIIFDINTGTFSTALYGTDTAFSRTGLWMTGDKIYGLDITGNIITRFDRGLLLLSGTYPVAGIPSNALFGTSGRFNMLGVNNDVLIIPHYNTMGVVNVYNRDFSTLITTITLPGVTVVDDFGLGSFIQSGYFDSVNNKIYIYDTGSHELHVIDATDYSIINSTVIIIGTETDYDYALARFVLDPITADLYMCFDIVDTAGDDVHRRVFILNRATGGILVTFDDIDIIGELVREGYTPYMWACAPGKMEAGGGSWAIDGQIAKYSH